VRAWFSLRKKHTKTDAATELKYALDLSAAYRSVFQGNPDRQQQQAVLADLAARCHWNQITVPTSKASSEELWFREGKRAAFSEIFSHLSLSPEDLQALENAARHEAVRLSNPYDAND